MWQGVLAVALIGAVLVWLLRGRRNRSEPDASAGTWEEIEAAEELRQAEDEVRDLGAQTGPEDEQPGDDWGPGTASSYR